MNPIYIRANVTCTVLAPFKFREADGTREAACISQLYRILRGFVLPLGKGKKKQTNMNVSELQKSFQLRWFLNIWKGSILSLFPANYK